MSKLCFKIKIIFLQLHSARKVNIRLIYYTISIYSGNLFKHTYTNIFIYENNLLFKYVTCIQKFQEEQAGVDPELFRSKLTYRPPSVTDDGMRSYTYNC